MDNLDNNNVSTVALDALVPPPESAVRQKAPRGFAAMSPEKRKELSSRGGKSAWSKGTAHKFTSEQAKEAGRKGGLTPKTSRAKAVE